MSGWMHQSKSGGKVQKDIRKKATAASGSGMVNAIGKAASKRNKAIAELMK